MWLVSGLTWSRKAVQLHLGTDVAAFERTEIAIGICLLWRAWTIHWRQQLLDDMMIVRWKERNNEQER